MSLSNISVSSGGQHEVVRCTCIKMESCALISRSPCCASKATQSRGRDCSNGLVNCLGEITRPRWLVATRSRYFPRLAPTAQCLLLRRGASICAGGFVGLKSPCRPCGPIIEQVGARPVGPGVSLPDLLLKHNCACAVFVQGCTSCFSFSWIPGGQVSVSVRLSHSPGVRACPALFRLIQG